MTPAATKVLEIIKAAEAEGDLEAATITVAGTSCTYGQMGHITTSNAVVNQLKAAGVIEEKYCEGLAPGRGYKAYRVKNAS
jgi:uncharacterized NAD-dependent epimerase/dehydratase family protein